MSDVPLKDYFNAVLGNKSDLNKEQLEYIREKIQELRIYTNMQFEYIYNKFKSERDLTDKCINSIDLQLDGIKEFTEIQAKSIKEATDIVAKSMDERFAKTNEFREALSNQQKTFVTRDEYSAIISKIDEDIQNLIRGTSVFITADNYQANHKTLEVKIEAIQKIVWSGLAIVSFLVFAVPLLMHFLEISK